jgi:glycosyltransferase involved in cell wall biosynthesis
MTNVYLKLAEKILKAEKISIIIPVYNEISTLKQILEKVESAELCSLQKEIILVDDGSKDGTRELLKEFEHKYKILFHARNMGKGAAIRTALYYATGDIIIIQDADLEYNPDDYNELVRLIINDEVDVAYGSRFLAEESRKRFKVLQYIGNKVLTLFTNMLFGVKLTDMETCYKAFRADVIRNISIKSNKFDFEPEITAKILKLKYYLKEIPISYNGRNYTEGKKIGWKDGLCAIHALIWYRIFD